MRDPAVIQADIDRLRSISTSGVMRYRHGEREVTYASRAEVDAAIAQLEAELDQAVAGETIATRPVAISRIRSRGRGL